MLIIRLHREGKKNSASFRVVVTEKQNAAKGKFLEILGSYDPHLNSKIFKKERINYWLSKGAKTSDTAHNLLVYAAKGKFLEILGSYDPHLNSKIFKKERINYWLSKGAKTSDTAHNLLVSAGIIKGPKKTIKIKKGAAQAGQTTAATPAVATAPETAS